MGTDGHGWARINTSEGEMAPVSASARLFSSSSRLARKIRFRFPGFPVSRFPPLRLGASAGESTLLGRSEDRHDQVAHVILKPGLVEAGGELQGFGRLFLPKNWIGLPSGQALGGAGIEFFLGGYVLADTGFRTGGQTVSPWAEGKAGQSLDLGFDQRNAAGIMQAGGDESALASP
jgi:hypothetical protein